MAEKSKKGWVVRVIPKRNVDKSVPEFILRPNTDNIKWSKAHAKKEAEHSKKYAKIGGNYSFSDLYNYRVITADEARRRGFKLDTYLTFRNGCASGVCVR